MRHLLLGLAVTASLAWLTAEGPTANDLGGAWAGIASHENETSPVALELEPGDDGKILIKATVPAIKVRQRPIARVVLEVQGNEVHLGPFTFVYDAEAKTLSGTMPEAIVPVYRVPVVLHRVARIEVAPPNDAPVPAAQPLWRFDAGSPLWPGARFSNGVVYAGAEDGRLHALDAGTGRERWSFRAGGAIRTRPTIVAGEVVFQADDGFLYCLGAASGRERWRVRLVEKPIERLPFDNPKSRYDRVGSDVTVSGGSLYLGTHDGHVLALDRRSGARIWDFATGDSVLAAPAVQSGRVYAGSYDGHVYALDAAAGRLVWKRDTAKPVVSTPAVDGDRVVVGSRSYDLFGLDARTGEPAWKRYVWFSWIESSATIRDGVAYVGSSDAALLSAIEARTGRLLWGADVRGWAWGQPAVTKDRVYV